VTESILRYRTIVADPPWPVGEFPPNFGYARGKGTPYPTMSVAVIRALPVSGLSAPGAHLFLWTINDHLEAAFGVARAWGFEPSATLAWCKPPYGLGLGGKFASNIEFVLYCRDFAGVNRITAYLADAADRAGVTRAEVNRAMGTTDMASWWLSRLPRRSKVPTWEQWEQLKALTGAGDDYDGDVKAWNEFKGDEPRADTRWWSWPRGAHSEKPEAFLDLVESVCPGRYLELFARRNRLGWDTWGNEALEHVEVTA
jgi:N6-adenosine-specific RNA methylase IME4